MKHSRNKFFNGVIFIIILMVIATPLIVITNLITETNPDKVVAKSVLMFLAAFFICIVMLLVLNRLFEESKKQEKLEMLEEAKEKLTSDFKSVILNRSNAIPKECFECKAKINEEGEIICRIHLDIETKMNDYDVFFEFFNFPE